MESNQQQQRLEAAQDFEEALEQLEDILQESSTDDEEIPDSSTDTLNTEEQNEDANNPDLAAWEDAVADIEQYLEEKTKNH